MGAGHGGLHDAEDVHAAFLRLRQRGVHDLLGDAGDLDVHLQRGDAGFGAGHLEVHIAEVVLVAENVGQHGELAAFLDEAHGDAGDVVLHRHAGVHQRQAAAAHRGHRRRSVGFGDFRHHAQGVAELLLGGQHREQCALGQAAVADLAALGAADPAGLAGGVGRHVVVQHEAVGVGAFERVDGLLVAAGAERGDDQRLGLAAGEQRGPVGARQHAGADGDRTHGAGVAAVDARLARQDAVAHHAGFETVESVLHHVGGDGVHLGRDQFGEGLAAHLVDRGHARLFLLDVVGLLQAGFGQRLQAVDHRGVLGGRFPLPGVGACFVGQLVDRVDRCLHLGVAEHHPTQHDVFRQLHGLGFHHQHGGRSAGDDEVERRILELGVGRVEYVFAVDEAHACGADRAVERQAGQRQRGRCPDQGGDVGADLGVGRDHRGDDLHFIEETFGEERTDRAVDQARGQRLALGRAALAFEEAPRDAPGGVGFFLVVDGQREEILPRLDLVLGDHGDQHHGVVHVDDDGAGGLAGDFTRFQGDLVAAEGECFLDCTHANSFPKTQTPRLGRGAAGSGAPRRGPVADDVVAMLHRGCAALTCAGRDVR